MAFEIGGGPDLPDLPDCYTGISGHQPDAPVVGLLGHPMDRQGQDFLDLVSSQRQELPAARQVLQTVEAASM